MPAEKEGEMIKNLETLEEWVERINKETIWREIALLVAHAYKKDKVQVYRLMYRDKIIKHLADAFTADIFSPSWPQPPSAITVEISSDILAHATRVLLHASQEITRHLPATGKLWRSLHVLYNESKQLKEETVMLRERIAELEEELAYGLERKPEK